MTATLPSATKLLWLLSTNARRRRLKLARAAFPDEVDLVTTAMWFQQLEGLEGDVQLCVLDRLDIRRNRNWRRQLELKLLARGAAVNS